MLLQSPCKHILMFLDTIVFVMFIYIVQVHLVSLLLSLIPNFSNTDALGWWLDLTTQNVRI